MPLYSIDIASRQMSVIKPTTFEGQGIQEPRDLRPLLAANLEKLDPNWFLLSEEFSGWEGSNRAIDILAVVRDGDEAHLVVIELKRTADGGHMDLQAIRYAAMVAPFNFDEIVRIHAEYLEKYGKPAEQARVSLLQHLGAELEGTISLSNRPRIVLVSWGFSREISATVLWLNSTGMDIRCFAAQPYKIQDTLYLDVEQVIPLRSAQEYEFRLRDKQIQRDDIVAQQRRERRANTIPTLIREGILTPGTVIELIKSPRPNLMIPDHSATAVFRAGTQKNFEWEDGQLYSISELTRVVCLKYGGDEGSGAFAGPDYWAIQGDLQSLSIRAATLGSEVAPIFSEAVMEVNEV